MNNLYFYTWNNYYNRQYKGQPTPADLEDYLVGSIAQANFNPNDGVNTEQIIQTLDWQNFDSVPDYMMVCEPSYFDDEGKLVPGDVVSRWFVVEATRERSGQYTALLRRDLVADFYEDIINAPAFIEKATLDINDPLIYNSEQMTYNQIKQSEFLIRDNTTIPWIVGYYALPTVAGVEGEEAGTGEGPVEVGIQDFRIDKTTTNIETYNTYANQGTFYQVERAELRVNAWFNRGNNQVYQFTFYPKYNAEGSYNQELVNFSDAYGYYSLFGADGARAMKQLQEAQKENLEAEYIASRKKIDGIDDENLNKMTQLAGTIIKDTTTGKIYKVNLSYGNLEQKTVNRLELFNNDNYDTLRSNIDLAIPSTLFSVEGKLAREPYYQWEVYQRKIIYSFTEITNTSGTFLNIDTGRNKLRDAPYCMFCMPYGEMDITYKIGETAKTFTTSKANALSIGASLWANRPGFVYDVQIMSFCPIEAIRNKVSGVPGHKALDIREGFVDAVDYTTSLFDVNQIMFWADSSQGSFDVPFTNGQGINFPTSLTGLWLSKYETWTPLQVKTLSETSMYRLCGPNYASQFEYNFAKNKGYSEGTKYLFHVDYGYKPYSPYVRVCPIFGGLYGQNFNDARGLIYQGDFSLTSITNRWAEYQIQNKNFQNAFDRQIENMEVQNKYARLQEKVGIVAGAIGAGGAGAQTGTWVAGTQGALAGGLIRGATSIATGMIDYQINEQLRNEAMDYTKDSFGFALGNIQALPHTINKVSAINPNFRFFPVLEIYDATQEEKNALEQKIRYNGMTVGRINTISAYLRSEPTYIKAQIIRMETIPDDTHVLNEIANEINKGVYIY